MRTSLSPLVSTLILAGLLLSPSSLTYAQTRHTSQKAAAAMSNSDVIALSSAGLGDDVVIAKIHAASSSNFDTSVQGLSGLKASGVSSTVIRYMIDPSAPVVAPAPAPVAPAASAAASVAAANNPDDPESVHPPGIYMLATGNDGKLHLMKLDHIAAKQAKSSGGMLSAYTYGITKAHTKAVIDGDRATVHTRDTAPTFYAYIPEDNSSFGGNPITAKDLTLIKFDTKASAREVVTGSASIWGASSGTDDKAKQGFSSEMLKTGVYKLTVNQPLPVGQFAFQQQNFTAFFDFGITPSE